MWLFFALSTPLFWAIVHVMDSDCVEEIFEKPWMGAITSALASIVVFVPLPFLLPFLGWEMPRWETIVLALIAGMLIQISQALYFQALAYSESGVVAAYWNMTPALLPIASFITTGSILSGTKYAGILILITASIGMCLVDTRLETRWRSFFLMLGASCLQVIFFLIEDHIYQEISFLLGFYIIAIGLIITGSLPLFHPRVFSLFKRNASVLKSASIIFVSIEIINLCALFTTQKAVDLGLPSLVAAVESTIPAYTFVLSILLYQFNSRLGDQRSVNFLISKLLLVTIMVAGVYFVA